MSNRYEQQSGIWLSFHNCIYIQAHARILIYRRGLLPARFVEHVHLHEQEAFFDQRIKYTEHVLSK